MPLAEDLHLAYADYLTHDSYGTGINGSGGAMYRLVRGVAARTAGMIFKQSIGIERKRLKMSNLCIDDDIPGKLFEVGCGSGDFLARMRACGWDVEGVDFDPKAAGNARRKHGLAIHTGTMEQLDLPSETYDVVAMSHVIEHVCDPVSMLRECLRILNRSGKLVLVTPNADSLGHRLYKGSWLHLDPPRHINLFSPAGIRIIVQKAGFAGIEVATSAVNAEGVLRGSRHIEKYGLHSMTEPFSIHEVFKYMALQFYEYLLVSRGLPAGEELLCTAYRK